MPQAAKALHSTTVVYQLRKHSGPLCKAAQLSCGLEIGERLPGFLVRLFSYNGRCGHVDGFCGSTIDRQRKAGDLSAYETHEKLPHV